MSGLENWTINVALVIICGVLIWSVLHRWDQGE